jgi:hypothetical protein
MKRWMLVYLMLLLTGTVNAAPMAQAVEVDVPPWAAVGGGAALVAWVLVSLINRSSRNSNDALIEIAKTNGEALKLQREQFEADQKDKEEQRKIEREQLAARRADDEARNKNIGGLIDQMNMQNERMHNSEAEQMRTIVEQNRIALEETAAKHKLAESIAAMNQEDSRHNQELETRMSRFETAITTVQNDIKAVKASVGPNAAVKLSAVEATLRKLSLDFHALVNAIKDGKPIEITEGTKDETSTDPTHPTGAADAPGTGADAGADGGRDA